MTVLSMVPNDTPLLPAKVIDVPKDVLRNFPHSKKVGNYLLGNTLGEGSFAKVKEALHIPTGERVRDTNICVITFISQLQFLYKEPRNCQSEFDDPTQITV
ncbi:hypothetical protein DPMN_055151 [Dreissena polymorpha]|uniref:Protein kinase domain-containing protein n=1 Tax=Dreissena polymorpha TaxID=45954 RepID=A0A9D4HTQ7_DREPO|nr:hypothetical protein DPMN_055088 [Dreissena polymorpha]KAH3729133.1 hypothetical protein DPMN_055096 [Dreissena polymorpha]KAH3729185.1 hypothetical protein DPMN_055151 [Dreissena polymorpha]